MNDMYSLAPAGQPTGLQVPSGQPQGVKAALPPEEMDKIYSFAAQEFPQAKPEEVKTMVDQYAPMLPGDTAEDKISVFVQGMQQYGTKVAEEMFNKYSALQSAGEEQFNKWRDENQSGRMMSSVFAGLRAGYGSPDALNQNNTAWAQQEAAARDRTVGAAERKIALYDKAQSAAKMQQDMTAQALNMGIAKEQAEQAGKKFKLEYDELTNAANAAKRLRDPNSIESVTMRNLAAQVGAKLTGSETAEVLQKVIPVQAEVFKAMVDAQAKQQAHQVALRQLNLDERYKMGQLGIQQQEAATRQAREEREMKERSPDFQAEVVRKKEEAQAGVKREADRRASTVKIEAELIPSLDAAINANRKASGATTGPIAGIVPMVSQKGQAVENAFNRVQLDQVQRFLTEGGGGASMLNSNAEREKFESAGANVKFDKEVNQKILLTQKEVALKTLALNRGVPIERARSAVGMFNPDNPTEMILVMPPSDGKIQGKKALISPQGIVAFAEAGQKPEELKQYGFKEFTIPPNFRSIR